MLATLAEPPLTGAGLLYEPKYDGIRAIAEIVHDAAADLAVEPGASLYAVIKASAFRRLG